MDCPFCSIVKGKIPAQKVWENQDFILFLVREPINKGHVLLCPKKHVENVFDLLQPLYTKLFLTAKKIAPILKELTKAKRIGVAIEGFGVPHVHVHLVPVNKGNDLNPLRARRASARTLALIGQKMRSKFASIEK